MAQNPASAYGEDIRCISDADDLFSVVSGVDLIVQDSIHVVTQKDFLGPGGDGRGYDVRDLIGSRHEDLALQQPIIADVIARDDRVSSADVELTAITTRGLADVLIAVTGLTSDGAPFAFTKSVLELTSNLADPES